jgi:hypothetical protein
VSKLFCGKRSGERTKTDGFMTGFEGHAHPYKQNILRLDGEKSSILDLPEVKTTMEKTAPSPSASS